MYNYIIQNLIEPSLAQHANADLDKETLELVYKTYASSAAPGKTGMILCALGQTQHSYGAQNTRAMSIMQLLCGNIGIPGGGVNALHGELRRCSVALLLRQLMLTYRHFLGMVWQNA